MKSLARGKSIGWISLTDAMLVMVILSLGVSLTIQQRADKERKESEATLAENQKILEDAKVAMQKREKYEKAYKSLFDEAQSMKDDIASLNRERAKLRREEAKLKLNLQQKADALTLQQRELAWLRDEKLKNPEIHKELIGIKGNLEGVVLVVDTSKSMAGARWNHTKKVLGTWIQFLEVQQCGIVFFGKNVRRFPENGQMLPLTGKEGPRNRAMFVQELERVIPDGNTPTLEALKLAYEFEGIGSIILFTDGRPTGKDNNRFSQGVVDDILELASEYSDIPINAVGLGNYFEPELARFLLKLAEVSNGTFIGR